MDNDNIIFSTAGAIYNDAEEAGTNMPLALKPFKMPMLDSPFVRGSIIDVAIKYAHSWAVAILAQLEPGKKYAVHNLFQLVYNTNPIDANLTVEITELECTTRHNQYIHLNFTSEGADVNLCLSYENRIFSITYIKGFQFELNGNF
jgi:hypothetical protein